MGIGPWQPKGAWRTQGDIAVDVAGQIRIRLATLCLVAPWYTSQNLLPQSHELTILSPMSVQPIDGILNISQSVQSACLPGDSSLIQLVYNLR